MFSPSGEKSCDSKDSFCDKLEQVFDHFPKYHMKTLLRDFNAKLGREDICKPTIGNESLHQDGNDNCVRIVNFTASKNLVVNSTMLLHRNIHKYTGTSPGGKTDNQIRHIFIDRNFFRMYSMYDFSVELTVTLIAIWWLQKLGQLWH